MSPLLTGAGLQREPDVPVVFPVDLTLGRSQAAISEPKVLNREDLRPRCPRHGAAYVPDMRRLKVKTIAGTIGLATIVAAVVRELRLPADRRTWHGKLLDFVPYDFRRPTVARARHAMWSPDDPHLLMPRVFGIGWTLNLGRLSRQLDRVFRRSS